MSSVDERIVKMQFDNEEFKKRAAETKTSLTDLNKATDAAGKSKGLFSLASGMQTVAATASKMAIVTTTAIATITNKAVNAGLQLASSLTLDPIKAGFAEYESLLSKQNTIMNATGQSATAVKKVLNDLNKYSDKTIFSFGDMTEGLTSFVNAGVPLKQASQAMKGIANASALAGASTQEAQSSFRAFGQAMGQGFLGLQDFRQAAVTGKIGTVGFKQSLIDAAVAAGTLTKSGDKYITKSGQAITATKGFDLSLQEQWANTTVLNSALKAYGDEQTKLGKKAFKSAQDVRTFSAFMDTLKESLASGWSQIFTTLIGGLGESTKFWTGLSNAVGENVHGFFEFVNAAAQSFKALGGFGIILQGIQNILAPFKAIIKAVGDAWKAAFPGKGPGSGEVLINIAEAFELITRPLAWFAKLIPQIVPILAVFFKIIALGASSVGDLAQYIGDLVTQMTSAIDLKEPSGGGLIKFFDKLIGKVGDIFGKGVDFAKMFLEGLVEGFQNGSFDTAAGIIGTGLLAGIFIVIKKALKNFGTGGGLLSTITGPFEALTGTLQSMQTTLQSKTLMNIAIAIALLTASVIGLSMVDADKLKKGLAAMAVGFGQLLAAMAILVKISGNAGFLKVPLIAASMVLLAASIFLLVGAIALMGQLEWETIGKGLAGIAGALVVIAAGMQLMPKTLPITAAGLVLVGVALNAIASAIAIIGNLEWETIGKGLVGIAGALVIIAGAMQLMPVTLPVTAAGLVLVGIALNAIGAALAIMGGMSWEEIGKGLVALGGAMAILAAGLNLMGGTLAGSAGLLVAAGAIAVLVPSLVILSKLSWKAIAKGLVGIGGALVVLAAGLTLMSGSLAGAAALLIVAPALLALSTALVALGSLSWEELGTAIVALAAGLAVLGLAGLLLAPVIPALMGLGIALTLMGAGLALAGLGILAFTSGLPLLVAMGAGEISYFSQSLETFIDLLPMIGMGLGFAIVEAAKVVKDNAPVVVDAIITMVKGLLDGAQELLPELGKLFGKYLDVVIGVIREYVPKLIDLAGDLVIALIEGLGGRMPEVVSAAVDVIIKFAEGLADNSIKLLNAGVDLIAGFLHDLATTIRDGSDKIGAGLTDVVDAFFDVGVNMVKGLIEGIKSMGDEALGTITGLGGDLVNGAMDFLGIKSPSRVFMKIGEFLVSGLTLGIQNHAVSAITAVASMVSGQIAVANEYVSKFIQDLDQKALAARAKADGLTAAADRASKAASKTKSKTDDRAADRLQTQAERVAAQADELEAKAERAREDRSRKEEFNDASLIEKAQMRSLDAQNQLDAAKAAEQKAASERIQADALIRQSKVSGVTRAQREEFERQAKALRQRALEDAKRANALIDQAKSSAADALRYQKLAGDEAAKAFQEAFESDAKTAADEEAFSKLSNTEKAELRRKQAEELQKKATEDLAAAKRLAYTDIEAANELAAIALAEAEQARRYLSEAEGFSSQKTGGGILGTVVNLDPTEDAALRMREYEDLYQVGIAGASAGNHLEFNQYNSSPEALPPSEIYRNTNSVVTFAIDKLDEVTKPN